MLSDDTSYRLLTAIATERLPLRFFLTSPEFFAWRTLAPRDAALIRLIAISPLPRQVFSPPFFRHRPRVCRAP
jgi:hypothetical protein